MAWRSVVNFVNNIVSSIIIFIPFLFIFILIFTTLIFVLIVIKKGNKFDKMVFITKFSGNQILERMKIKTVKDIFLFEFYHDNELQNYILITKEINKDWYYKEGKVKYRFIMKKCTEGTEIYLNVIERSSPLAQLRYGSVMKEFMYKKLEAKLPF